MYSAKNKQPYSSKVDPSTIKYSDSSKIHPSSRYSRHQNLPVHPHPVMPVNFKSTETQTDHLNEWLGVTPWHCVVNILRAKKKASKLAWFSVIALASFIAFYQSCVLISDYINDSKWVTSVSYETPPDGSLPWPNITICNLNSNFKTLMDNADYTDPYDIAYMTTKMNPESVRFYKKFQETREAFRSLRDQDLIDRAKELSMRRLERNSNLTGSDVSRVN
jgi:hypothetical protein